MWSCSLRPAPCCAAVVPPPGETQHSILRSAALAAKWKEPPRDALDTLVLKTSLKEEDLHDLTDKYEQIDFLPFDPTIKRTEGTLREKATGKTFKTTKGAPHIILKLVEVDQEEVAKRVNWKVGGCERGVCLQGAAGGLLAGAREGGGLLAGAWVEVGGVGEVACRGGWLAGEPV